MSCGFNTSSVILDGAVCCVFPFEVCRNLLVAPDSVWSYVLQGLGINLCFAASLLYYFIPIGAVVMSDNVPEFVIFMFYNMMVALFGIAPLMGVFGFLTLVQIRVVYVALWGIAYMCGVAEEKPYLI
jgi:hypothetical protein